jgi:hypothetical protein
MGRAFVTRKFNAFARDERIREADQGLINAKLRGCLVKLRIARQGEGRSGGYRAIAAFQSRAKAFYRLGYPKNVRDDLSDNEVKYLDEAGRLLLALDDAALSALIDAGKLRELGSDGIRERHEQS